MTTDNKTQTKANSAGPSSLPKNGDVWSPIRELTGLDINQPECSKTACVTQPNRQSFAVCMLQQKGNIQKNAAKRVLFFILFERLCRTGTAHILHTFM